MREDRAKLYQKLKDRQKSRAFLQNFFTYTPEIRRKFRVGGNISKLFPRKKGVDYSKLKITAEGEYSITKPWDSEHIIKVMQDSVGDLGNKTIADLTGNVGGDTIRFGMNFKHVDTYELDKENFDALQNNVGLYDLKNVSIHHGDSTKLFNRHVDVVYIDAPWGGPDYKLIEMNKLDLYLGTKRLDLFLKKILKESWKPSYIFLKVPRNFTFFRLKTLPNIEKIYKNKIRSFYLIGLKTNL